MFEVKFADIGEGIHEGVLYKIKVEIGDDIEEGQTLFLVETDKVTAEIPSPVDGVLKEIHFEEGDEIEVGQTIVTIDTDPGGSSETDEEEKSSKKERSDEEEKSSKKEASDEEEKSSKKEASDEDKKSSKKESADEKDVSQDKKDKSQEEKSSSKSKEDDDDSASVVGDLEYSSDVIPSSQEGRETSEENRTKVLATPVARKLAKDLKVDIQEVKGTGPGGRVMKEDIKKFADEKEGKESKGSKDQKKSEAIKDHDNYEKVSMNTMRKTISKHMTKSKFTIPHTAVMDEIVVDSLVAYRAKLKERLKDRDISITYLPFIIKALTVALKKHEILNASLDESEENILIHKNINIGVAVDTPHGLMVPVIKNADHLSIIELSEKIVELNDKAQNKTLSMDEISGSTFTLTNYGAFGSSFGVPIINYPNSAIVGIGKISKKPWVIDDKIDVASVLPLSMAFDHRIMDGADVGRFLNTFKSLLNDVELLLIS